MNSKGALSSAVVAAILLTFLLAALIVYFVGPEALAPKAAEALDFFAERLPSSNAEQFRKPVEVDRNIKDAFESIVSALRSEVYGPCVLRHSPLPKDFKNFRITLSQANEGTATFAQLIDKDERTVEKSTISGRIPCIVGEGRAAENFLNNNVKGNCKSSCPQDYNGANIEFHDGNNIYINGQKRAYNMGNLLFKTRDNNICFFSTYPGWFTKPGCDSAEKGLDDDCVNGIVGSVTECKKIDEWQAILQEYEKNKCKVNKHTCKVENFPCQCFTSTQKENKLKPDVCTMQKPYCYDGVEGCSDKGPDIGYYLFVCKETNKNFQLAPKCSVDISTCKVRNAPCTCYITKPVAGKQSFPALCLEGQYCYNEQKGCSTESSSLDCQKSNKN
ncbi:hypothetical protein HYY71_04280 [Candidatus Woesearchaeota archaeon]|nr:hypothetical protein [Candidatus Woesearchaeota archaeon]